MNPTRTDDQATCALGILLDETGQREEAIDLLADTLERGRRYFPDDDWPTWRAGAKLAFVFGEAGRAEEAVGVGREVLAARRQLRGMDDVGTLATASTLGMHLEEVGDLDEAIDLFADTFERCKRHAPPNLTARRIGRRLSLAMAKAGRTKEGVGVAAKCWQMGAGCTVQTTSPRW